MSSPVIPTDKKGDLYDGVSPSKTRISPQAKFEVTSATAVSRTVGPLEYLEVHTTQPVYMKYGATAVTASNFDEHIPVGYRAFIIPQGITQVTFIADGTSANVIIIRK